MTITLEIPPETEATLTAQAKARGLSLDAFLRNIITMQAASPPANPAPALPGVDSLDGQIDELFDTVPVPPGVGEGAMHRENWYR